MTFDQFRRKVQKKVEELAAGKIFQSQEEKIQFFKIARRVCLAFWAISFIRIFSTLEAAAPLVIFTILIVLLSINVPGNKGL